jgi:hypothetical protein
MEAYNSDLDTLLTLIRAMIFKHECKLSAILLCFEKNNFYFCPSEVCILMVLILLDDVLLDL